MRRKLAPCAALALSLGVAAPAAAAGFAIDTQSARATGMATAVTGHIDDASAAYYNPAGIIQGKHLDLQLGDTLILPSLSFSDGTTTTQSSTGLAPPPNLYATYGVTEDFSVGVGIFTAYGLSGAWPVQWAGRFQITKASLATYTFNPELAYRIHPRIKVGAGMQIVRATVALDRATNFIDSEGAAQVGVGGWGWSPNAGVQVELVEKLLFLGINYRASVGLPLSGSAHFTGAPPELQRDIKDQGLSSRLTLPDNVTVGVAFHPLDTLRIGLDVNYTAWSSFGGLSLSFDDPKLNTRQPKDWQDTFNVHVGGEYAVNDSVKIRAGFQYDPSPSPANTLTPELPDANRVNLALGAGYRWNALQLDLGYQYVILAKATSTSPTFPGSYSGSAQVLGLSVGYRL